MDEPEFFGSVEEAVGLNAPTRSTHFECPRCGDVGPVTQSHACEPRPRRAIHTVLTNEDEGYRFSEEVEPLTDTYLGEDASMGDIFRLMREEYGRCQSKVYVDTDHGPKHVGWFFVRRQKYTDTAESYLCGAWVTVGEFEPAREASVKL